MTASEFLRAMANGRIRLEVYIAAHQTSSIHDFRAEYERRTGDQPGDGFSTPRSKRTQQFRIYCNIDGFVIEAMRRAGVNITTNQVYRRIYNVRFTDRQLFWELIDAGFRLGDN